MQGVKDQFLQSAKNQIDLSAKSPAVNSNEKKEQYKNEIQQNLHIFYQKASKVQNNIYLHKRAIAAKTEYEKHMEKIDNIKKVLNDSRKIISEIDQSSNILLTNTEKNDRQQDFSDNFKKYVINPNNNTEFSTEDIQFYASKMSIKLQGPAGGQLYEMIPQSNEYNYLDFRQMTKTNLYYMYKSNDKYQRCQQPFIIFENDCKNEEISKNFYKVTAKGFLSLEIKSKEGSFIMYLITLLIL